MSLLRQRATVCSVESTFSDLKPGVRASAVGERDQFGLGGRVVRVAVPGKARGRSCQGRDRRDPEQQRRGQRQPARDCPAGCGSRQAPFDPGPPWAAGMGSGAASTLGLDHARVRRAKVRVVRGSVVPVGLGGCWDHRCRSGGLGRVPDSPGRSAGLILSIGPSVRAPGMRRSANGARWARGGDTLPAILPSLGPPAGGIATHEHPAVALAQWQSIGLWLRRLRVRAP